MSPGTQVLDSLGITTWSLTLVGTIKVDVVASYCPPSFALAWNAQPHNALPLTQSSSPQFSLTFPVSLKLEVGALMVKGVPPEVLRLSKGFFSSENHFLKLASSCGLLANSLWDKTASCIGIRWELAWGALPWKALGRIIPSPSPVLLWIVLPNKYIQIWVLLAIFPPGSDLKYP